MTAPSLNRVWTATLLLVTLALLRPLRAGGERPSADAAWLPSALAGAVGQPVPLEASEQRLSRRRHVAVVKRRYGSTLATAVVVLGGIREHHPASVCLRASGLKVISKHRSSRSGHCISVLRVRRGASEAVVATTYLSGANEVTCSLTRRIAAGAWARLWGRASRWTHLQVLDADAERALSRIEALIDAMRRRSSQ